MKNRSYVAGGVLAVHLLAAPLLAGAPQAPAKVTAQPQTLPGGASQLQEIHGDWRVACVQQNSQRICSLIQQQADKDNGQLVVGVELRAMPGGTAEGTMVLPFGLAVGQPVALFLDDVPAMTLPFRTCLPVGCIVELALG